MTSPLRTTTLTTLLAGALLAGALLAAGAPDAAGQDGASHRDDFQRPADVAAVLGAGPGAHVADIGAGGGYFTQHLRRTVGPEGRIYAVDISRDAVTRLRGVLDLEGVRNVDVILGEPDDPRLPFGSLDGALIVNAYHEMTEYRAMLDAIREALRPGGRLVILDKPPSDPGASRAAQTGDHQLHIALAAGDLRDAGFEIVREDPGFIQDTTGGHDHRMWLIGARRPLEDPVIQRFPGAPAGTAGSFACPFPGPAGALAERLSPPDSAEAVVGGARVKVCYSRPSMRGRAIMGELVPFDEPWRTGADEATVLRTDRPLDVGGVRLEPGWYSVYTVPGRDAWTVVLNRLADRAGVPIDDWVRAHDVGRLTLPVEPTSEPVEALTLRFDPTGAGPATLVLEWERTRVRVPVSTAR
jgi:predicted methyltransferase